MRSVTTLRPVRDLCMSTERKMVGVMLFCLAKRKAIMYEIRNCSVLYKIKKKADVFQSLTFKDLNVRERFQARKSLNQYYEQLTGQSRKHKSL